MAPAAVFRCPVCGLGLFQTESLYRCGRGHCFDLARAGYVNLLPPRRPSLAGGDSGAMLHARRAFLEAGFYDRLSARIDGLVAAVAPGVDTAKLVVLDAGCGEGFYLRHLGQSESHVSRSQPLARYGIDISRRAVSLAARRDATGSYAVGTIHCLPVLDRSVDVLLSVFSHRSYPEFSRVLAGRGRLILVQPGTEHLRELREILYDDPRLRRDRQRGPVRRGPLAVTRSERLFYSVELSKGDIANLLSMTPFAAHARRDRQARLRRLPRLQVHADFLITTLEHRRSIG